MPLDLAQVETVFNEAIGKPTAVERATYLDEACADDADLRQRVEALLASHEASVSFLALPDPVGATHADTPLSERPGTRIGRYKLLQQIGEGGFGVVFMAEQEHPVRRTVAMKIIKLGMDTRQVVARFEVERQALAMMDHPSIAKVLDAGATDTGRPYFVMELIRGSPITEYCDKHKLTPRQRLELFVQVCQAVQHAHGKGIIHRDLKPNNVLVTVAEDGRPVPKVIDFGVAKATAGQRLTNRTLFTEFRQLIGTPLYMSPEQAELDGMADVDTRSDVYALGVLLYELLTGGTPFEKERLVGAAYEEVRRIIREEEPLRPSARLGTLAGEVLTAVAASRQTEPKRLGQLVRGELDWIVMRAMEKDRTRRYDTASGLAQDVERYLSDEPVEACPPSRVYRLRKFFRRNKGPVAAVMAVMLALILGLALATIGLIQASRQRAVAVHNAVVAQSQAARADREATNARTEAKRASRLNDFFKTTFRSANPEYRKTVLHILDDAGRGYGSPEIQAAIRNTLCLIYKDMGQLSVAEEHGRAALELTKQAYGPEHPSTAERMQDLYFVLREQGKLSEATHFAREALAIHRAVFGEEGGPTLDILDRLTAVLRVQGRIAEADMLNAELWGKNLEALQKELLTQNDSERRAATFLRLFWPLIRTNQVEQAKAVCRNALELNPRDAATGMAFNNAAWVLATDPKPARRDIDLSVELAKKAIELRPDHGFIWNTLGVARYRAGDYEAAVANLEKGAQLNNGGNSLDCFCLAVAHQRLGNAESARRWYDKGVQPLLNQLHQLPTDHEELNSFRAEAEEVLGVASQPASQPAKADD